MKIYTKYSIIIIILSLLINLINSSEGNLDDSVTDLHTTTDDTTNDNSIDIANTTIEETNNDINKSINFTKDIDTTKKVESTLEIGNEINVNNLNKKCSETEPSKGIIEDCSKGNNMTSPENMCCYMEIKYDYNKYYECIPLNLTNINWKETIIKKKKEYGANSIKIKCKSSFIRFKLLFLLLIWNLIF